MSDIALKSATTRTNCVINVDQAWYVAPNCPDLNPVDYAVLGAFQQMVCQRRKFTTINHVAEAGDRH